MPWLFSKNKFAHEDPATINAMMSASVEGKSPTIAPQPFSPIAIWIS